MKKSLAALFCMLALAGCMSENKAWLRAKELELKKEAVTEKTATLEGPATLTIEQGGKAYVK